MINMPVLQVLCARPDEWLIPLNLAMQRYDINTNSRMSMFLAQCAHESARFTRVEENLRYSASGILRTWPNRFTPEEATAYAMRPEAIANRAYAGRGGNGSEATGDGWRYRGRAPLQITLADNYKRCGEAIDLPLLEEPDLLLTPPGGALASAWFWWAAGCNEVADEHDFPGVSGLINRGNRNKTALHLAEREQWFAKAQIAMA